MHNLHMSSLFVIQDELSSYGCLDSTIFEQVIHDGHTTEGI